MLRVAQLGQEHGRRELGEGVAEAEEEAAAHEDAEGAPAALHEGAGDHDDATDDDGDLPAVVVGDEGDQRDGGHATDLVQGAEETQEGALGVTESLKEYDSVLVVCRHDPPQRACKQ